MYIKWHLASTKKDGEDFSLFHNSNSQLMGMPFPSRSHKKTTCSTLPGRAEVLSPTTRHSVPGEQGSPQGPRQSEEHLWEHQVSA